MREDSRSGFRGWRGLALFWGILLAAMGVGGSVLQILGPPVHEMPPLAPQASTALVAPKRLDPTERPQAAEPTSGKDAAQPAPVDPVVPEPASGTTPPSDLSQPEQEPLKQDADAKPVDSTISRQAPKPIVVIYYSPTPVSAEETARNLASTIDSDIVVDLQEQDDLPKMATIRLADAQYHDLARAIGARLNSAWKIEPSLSRGGTQPSPIEVWLPPNAKLRVNPS
jgi:hypothetical protein